MPKIYTNYVGNLFVQLATLAANMAGQTVEVVPLTPEQIQDKDFQAKKGAWGFPLLELESGEIIAESSAIAAYFARQGDVYGSTPFETAKCDEWIAFSQTSIIPAIMPVLRAVFGHAVMPSADFAKAVNNLKAKAKIVNSYLEGKQFLVGDKFSVADAAVSVSFLIAFQTVFDGGFRKGMANLSGWFERCIAQPAFVATCGNIKLVEKALKAFDPKTAPAPKKEVKQEAKKEEAPAEAGDDLDLFGDDDNEADAEEAKAKIAAQKTEKKKKVVIAKSVVYFEVKPLDSETDLDEMAKRIFALEGEGIHWRTEYKKEPIAFGIFKLVVGVTVEDEKVSVDGLQERIEAIDDMVQSVEIIAFNKV